MSIFSGRRRGTTRFRDPGPVAAMPVPLHTEPTRPPIEHVEETTRRLAAMTGGLDQAFRELDEARELFSESERAGRERSILAAGQREYGSIIKEAAATARRVEGEIGWTETFYGPSDADRARLLSEEQAAMARVAPLVEAGHVPGDLVAHFARLGDAAAVRALAANGAALLLARGGREGLDDPAVEAELRSFTEHAERASEMFLPAGLREARETRRRLDAATEAIVEHRRLTEKQLRGEPVSSDEKIAVGLQEIESAVLGRSGHSRQGIWAEQAAES